MKKLSIASVLKKYYVNARNNIAPKLPHPLPIENPESLAIKFYLPNKYLNLQQTQTSEKSKDKQDTFITPKNKFSFIQVIDELSSITDEKRENKNLKKLEIKLPDPFKNCLLEPSEYAVRYNPKYVVEFSRDIFSYLKLIQNTNNPKNSFISSHSKITKSKRALLVNNLVLIHTQFELLDETLFLTVNILDRYLSNEGSKIKNDLEFLLLGITSMLIASKFEEIYYPEIRDFITITKFLFTKESIIHMEEKILSSINYDVLYVPPLAFLERLYFLSGNKSEKVYYLSKYLLELTLLDDKFYEYSSLMKAASALYLSNRINKMRNPWNNILRFHSQLNENDMRKCAREICLILNNIKNTGMKGLTVKYSMEKYKNISLM